MDKQNKKIGKSLGFQMIVCVVLWVATGTSRSAKGITNGSEQRAGTFNSGFRNEEMVFNVGEMCANSRLSVLGWKHSTK